jgi:PKHD-type hydroxylase
MNLTNYYWYFQSVIPNRICDDIIKYGNSIRDQQASIGGLKDVSGLTEKQVNDFKKKRKSNVAWLNDEWIYKEIHPYVRSANENAGWNYDWDWSEACQFTKYNKGQYYDWHTDILNQPFNRPDNLNFHGKNRKLSLTLSLSDPTTYEGGDLEFDFRNEDPQLDKKKSTKICREILPKGSIVVFPSFVWHRVKPVKKGVRYSLVIWSVGYPFR